MPNDTAHRISPPKTLSLPPVYSLIALNGGDAFAEAQACASEGAGTLVWAQRENLADFAVVLEPEQPFETAVLSFFACMNAVADALASFAPPEKPMSIAWPDEFIVDGGLAGGGRMAWPEGTEAGDVPEWLVFGATIRLSAPKGTELGAWPRGTTLDDEAYDDVTAPAFIETASRYLLHALHQFGETGSAGETTRYFQLVADQSPERIRAITASPFKVLTDALASPSWHDPVTDEPWR